MTARMGGPATAVNARIIYWGIPGAGVSSSLRRISAKLRPDHRGELQEIPTRLDPTVVYELLPIKLGEIAGVDTRLEIVAVPGGAEHAPTRKQLLDRSDGVVFVADLQRERLAESVESFEELRRALASYGRPIEAMPLVVQLNKRDLADPGSLEELVRKLDVPRAFLFETVASEGTGVLQVLSTISKRVVKSLRDLPGRARLTVSPPAPGPAPAPRVLAQTAPPPTPRPPPVVAREIPSPTPEPLPRPSPGPWPSLARPASSEPAPAPAPLLAPAPAPRAPLPAEEVTGPFDRGSERAAPGAAPTAPAASTLRILSVGVATVEGENAVRLPLEVADATGHRFRLSLTLSLGPMLSLGPPDPGAGPPADRSRTSRF